jgi:predicted HTH transcriptional regulator
MIFIKALSDLHFVNIQEFVDERRRDSEILDYKEDWPNDLAKVMAAMANTQGGAILVGVSEKPGTGKPDRIVGVDNPRGLDSLRQKVTSIAYQAVYPPLLPEVEA